MSGYGNLCTKHKARQRRHGHPEQKAIRKFDLKPYAEKVEQWIRMNRENKAWAIAEQRWTIFCDQAHLIDAKFHWPTREAVQAARIVAQHGPCSSGRGYCACHVPHGHLGPLESEKEFRAQLIRQARSLSSANVGEWKSATDHKPHCALLDLKREAVQVLSGWIVELLGHLGVYLSQKYQQEQATKVTERQELAEAMEGLDLS